jgi:hypothetical protein
MMGTVITSETSVNFNQITRRNISEDSNLWDKLFKLRLSTLKSQDCREDSFDLSI